MTPRERSQMLDLVARLRMAEYELADKTDELRGMRRLHRRAIDRARRAENRCKYLEGIFLVNHGRIP